MALRSKWTVQIRELETHLRVGIYAHEVAAQPILVNLVLSGLTDTDPQTLEQCIDYEPICHWIVDEWPKHAHTPLLETRVNELFDQVFQSDRKILNVWMGLYKPTAFTQAKFVGVEREMSRRQYDEYSKSKNRHRPS